MSYINESLSEGEEVLAVFHIHWLAYLWPVLMTLLTAGLLLPFALYQYLQLKYTEQGPTNKRVILKQGIVSRRTEEMKLRSVETVEIDQGIFGRIFDYGIIKISGRGISDVIFQNVDGPMKVKKAIESVSNPLD